ncbi:MAG: helix-turn-helix transcriptional regulator [Labilithrix sp.]|nr:helix-turn-helix transcriptional regulator [Labilithrix sp.]
MKVALAGRAITRRARGDEVGRVLRRGADWAGVVEATQLEARDDETWARHIVRAARPLFATAHEPSLVVAEHSPACDSARGVALAAARSELASVPDAGLATFGVSAFRGIYYPPTTARTHREIERTLSREVAVRTADLRRQIDAQDLIGLFAYPEPGVVVLLFIPYDREVHLTRYDRSLLARIALHVETSYRLRRRPEVLKAVLDVDGRVIERSEDAPPADVLASHAVSVTRARRERDGAEALALWPALVSGQLSLVERRSGTRQRYLFVENPAPSQPFRALSPAEVDVLSLAARGHPTKLIAYALGVSPSIVSMRMVSAAAKVGVSSRMELVRLAAMLARDPRARFVDIALTDAESDVLELLQRGLSNEEIAVMRSRSVRTIANQVASLLRKTQTRSRRELVVRAAGAERLGASLATSDVGRGPVKR